MPLCWEVSTEGPRICPRTRIHEHSGNGSSHPKSYDTQLQLPQSFRENPTGRRLLSLRLLFGQHWLRLAQTGNGTLLYEWSKVSSPNVLQLLKYIVDFLILPWIIWKMHFGRTLSTTYLRIRCLPKETRTLSQAWGAPTFSRTWLVKCSCIGTSTYCTNDLSLSMKYYT